MADPHHILSEKQLRVAELERALEGERAELRGMEFMVRQMTGGQAAKPQTRVGKVLQQISPSGGRQPGSISKRWRAALWALHNGYGPFGLSEIVQMVLVLEGRTLRPADARRQMDTYIEHGFVAGSPDEGYKVTDEFQSKFADDAPNGSNENGEPNGNAASSPDDGKEGVPPPTDPWGQPILSQAS